MFIVADLVSLIRQLDNNKVNIIGVVSGEVAE